MTLLAISLALWRIIVFVYEFRMVQIPAKVITEAHVHGTAGAHYLQELANFGAEKGWEFYRIDTLGHPPVSGCQIVTFRRLHVAPPSPPPTLAAHPVNTAQPYDPINPEDYEEPHQEKPWWR